MKLFERNLRRVAFAARGTALVAGGYHPDCTCARQRNRRAPRSNDDRMLTPPPVSGQSYPTSPTPAERSNYLRGGWHSPALYTDNALGSVNGHPVSDVSYSVAPTIALDETTSRLHLVYDLRTRIHFLPARELPE